MNNIREIVNSGRRQATSIFKRSKVKKRKTSMTFDKKQKRRISVSSATFSGQKDSKKMNKEMEYLRTKALCKYRYGLNVWGMQLVDSATGEVERDENWQANFHIINYTPHVHREITKCFRELAEAKYASLQKHFLTFLANEIFNEGTLTNCEDEFWRKWMPTLKDTKDRTEVYRAYLVAEEKGSASSADSYRLKVTQTGTDKPGSMSSRHFYQNKIGLPSGGDLIDEIHLNFWNDFGKLDSRSEYMTWLFPMLDAEVTSQEIQKMNEDENVRGRILLSYRMMLHFYGMQLVDSTTGEVTRGIHWKERLVFLNMSPNHYPRIERMLKSLGQFEFEYLKKPFLMFIASEIGTKMLVKCEKEMTSTWINTLKYYEEVLEVLASTRSNVNSVNSTFPISYEIPNANYQ